MLDSSSSAVPSFALGPSIRLIGLFLAPLVGLHYTSENHEQLVADSLRNSESLKTSSSLQQNSQV